jgi:hypothetical protein
VSVRREEGMGAGEEARLVVGQVHHAAYVSIDVAIFQTQTHG